MRSRRAGTAEVTSSAGGNNRQWICHRVAARAALVFLGAIAACLWSGVPARAQVIRQDFYITNGTVLAAVVSGNTLYIGGSFSQVSPATGGGVPISDATGLPTPGFPRRWR